MCYNPSMAHLISESITYILLFVALYLEVFFLITSLQCYRLRCDRGIVFLRFSHVFKTEVL